MNRIKKKTETESSRSAGQPAITVVRTASPSVRDPLAYAAALKILG